jgi:hypothetical protein
MFDLNHSKTPGVFDRKTDTLAEIQSDNINSADSLSTIITTQSPPSEPETMSWTEFYRMMDEILPPDLKRNKANSDPAIALAVSKGFDGWRYDSKMKNFTHIHNPDD